jgi:hypothetical protein
MTVRKELASRLWRLHTKRTHTTSWLFSFVYSWSGFVKNEICHAEFATICWYMKMLDGLAGVDIAPRSALHRIDESTQALSGIRSVADSMTKRMTF